jgi:16S rRNA (guanine527-N7)-methyltransferase
MSRSKFLQYHPVPHETFEKLSAYVNLLLKWNSKINLISKNTVDEIWIRHILDSAQIIKYIDNMSCKVLDIGSGAGLPGVILSILGVENITLVDSDQRKCSFLLETARLLDLKLIVINDRVENICDKEFDVVTARGFASIDKVLREVSSIKSDKILLLKGKNYNAEVQEALQKWEFEYITYPSITDFSAYILGITNVQKK